MPELVLEHTFAASPERVWDVLIDFERYEEWHPYETIVGAAEPLKIVTVTDRPHRQGPVTAVDRAIVWKVEPPAKLELIVGKFAKRFFHLEAHDGGTRLTHGLRWSPILVNRLTAPTFNSADVKATYAVVIQALETRVASTRTSRPRSAMNRSQRRTAHARGKE